MRLKDGFSKEVIFEISVDASERLFQQKSGETLRQRKPGGMLVDDSSILQCGLRVLSPLFGFFIAPEEIIIF